MPELLVAALLLVHALLAAIVRAAPRPGEFYRGTPVEWPRPPLRLHPRFERLPR